MYSICNYRKHVFNARVGTSVVRCKPWHHVSRLSILLTYLSPPFPDSRVDFRPLIRRLLQCYKLYRSLDYVSSWYPSDDSVV